MMYRYFFKRFFDFFFSFFLLLFLAPLFIIILICLIFVNKGNPFFIQKRPGLEERIFSVIKFKTMNDKCDNEGLLLKDAERLTRVGRFIRKTSLDEIPQLINVLIGDMSFVGPRPLLPEYLEVYDNSQKKRHNVKPGITGLAQIKGRNQLVFSKRLKYDVFYVKKQSFFFDLMILCMTLHTVFLKTKNIVSGQTVDDVDDIGLSKKLSSNHFR